MNYINYKYKLKEKSLSLLSGLLGLIFSVGCSTEKMDNPSDLSIDFGAQVRNNADVKTRALTTEYIESEPFDMDFYIQLVCDPENGAPYKETGVYTVPSGYKGRLNAKISNEALNWHDLTSPHTFWGWNTPWLENYTPENDPNPLTIEFKNSIGKEGPDGFETNRNNLIYENFIGTKSGPYSYNTHGKYVDLTFSHLVSKIVIDMLQLTEAGGSIHRNIMADITFLGMPYKASFTPHPDGDGAPVVTWTENDVDLDAGVTYFISNSPRGDEGDGSDIFYVAPEMDFSQLEFKINVRDSRYADLDTYYGTFDGVKFERIAGEDHDLGEGLDDTVLHAGEVMHLYINLIPGVGPGLAIIIDNWNDEQETESQYHTYPGIYSDSEIKSIYDIFNSQTWENFCQELDNIERLFELYGYEDEETGQSIFRLYDNVTIDTSVFPIYRKYLLDGMGHIIFMKTNNGQPVGTNWGTVRYFNVGPMRDVYLVEGNNRIYIDGDGFVYTYNSVTGTYTRTENQLQELTGAQKSYDINCVTGQIKQSNYYPGLGETGQEFPNCQ